MLDILKAAAAESEETSDKFVDEFFEKSLTLEEFLEKFKETRNQMHLRKLKAEKMQELLRQQGGHGPSNGRYPPPSNNFYGSPNAAPYPNMPGFPMPMPPTYRSPY
jgi:ESCRT-I complex subunit VPS37